MAYGHHRTGAEEIVLVLDLGGGTYDVSLLESFEGCLEVLGTEGDPALGGDDFDHALAAWLAEEAGIGDMARSNPPLLLVLEMKRCSHG